MGLELRHDMSMIGTGMDKSHLKVTNVKNSNTMKIFAKNLFVFKVNEKVEMKIHSRPFFSTELSLK